MSAATRSEENSTALEQARAKVEARLAEAREASLKLDAAWAIHNAAQTLLVAAEQELKHLQQQRPARRGRK